MKNVLVLTLMATVAGTAALAQTAGPAAELAPTTLSVPSIKAFPSSFGVASAVPAPPNTGYVGVGYANPRGGVSGEGGDGDLFGGYTVGNPISGLAVTFGLAVTSINADSDFGDSGAASVSLSRLAFAGESSATFIGATASNLAAWGDADDSDEGGSVQISHVQDFSGLPVQFIVGYQADNTYDDDGSGDLSDGAFGGLGFGLTPTISGGVSFTETQVNVGINGPLPIANTSFSAGVFDATDNVDRQQFSLTLVYSF